MMIGYVSQLIVRKPNFTHLMYCSSWVLPGAPSTSGLFDFSCLRLLRYFSTCARTEGVSFLYSACTTSFWIWSRVLRFFRPPSGAPPWLPVLPVLSVAASLSSFLA